MHHVVTKQWRGRVTVATCSGELDMAVLGDLAEGLAGVVDDDTLGVVVDLSGVTFLDCACLRVFLGLVADCETTGKRAVLCGARPIVMRLLTVLDLADRLPMRPDLDAAVEYVLVGRKPRVAARGA